MSSEVQSEKSEKPQRNQAVGKGQTRREAVRKAAKKLAREPTELIIHEVQQGSSGFLGFFQRPWIVRARLKRNRPSIRDATVEEALKAAEAVEGSFQLNVEGRKVLLTVHPPSGTGEPVDADSIILHLSQIGADYCDFDKVRSVAENMKGEPRQIGTLPEDERIDAAYDITITENGLQATMTILPPKFGGRDPDLDTARRELDRAGIIEGIDWDTLEHMIEEKRYREEVVIARGRPPKKGQGGEVKYFFNTSQQPEFSEEDQQVDFRELGLVQNVSKGELLAERIEPTPGRSGLSVTGESIEAEPGDEAELNYGEGVRREGEKLYADREGNVSLEEGVVKVHNIFEVEGDVDYSVGNIDFQGTVIIGGSVRDRFRVQATGDILIQKQVGRAYLEAGQDIIIQGGIQGKSDAHIQAGGSIAAEFVQQANLIAQHHVVIDELVLHSKIDAGEQLYVGDGKGLLAGGRVRAGQLVYASEIGSVGASETRVEVGIDPQFFRDMARIESKITDQQQKLDKVERAINTLEGRKDLSDDDQANLDKLLNNRKNLERNIENQREEQKNLARRADVRPGARVAASEIIRAGCRVSIGNQIYHVTRDMESCTLRKRGDRVEQTPFEKPDRPELS